MEQNERRLRTDTSYWVAAAAAAADLVWFASVTSAPPDTWGGGDDCTEEIARPHRLQDLWLRKKVLGYDRLNTKVCRKGGGNEGASVCVVLRDIWTFDPDIFLPARLPTPVPMCNDDAAALDCPQDTHASRARLNERRYVAAAGYRLVQGNQAFVKVARVL